MVNISRARRDLWSLQFTDEAGSLLADSFRTISCNEYDCIAKFLVFTPEFWVFSRAIASDNDSRCCIRSFSHDNRHQAKWKEKNKIKQEKYLFSSEVLFALQSVNIINMQGPWWWKIKKHENTANSNRENHLSREMCMFKDLFWDLLLVYNLSEKQIPAFWN